LPKVLRKFLPENEQPPAPTAPVVEQPPAAEVMHDA